MIWLAFACAHRPATSVGGDLADIRRGVRREGVAVAPVAWVGELAPEAVEVSPAGSAMEALQQKGDDHLPVPTVLDPADPEAAAFLRNEFIGAIGFGGGLIRTGETTLEVRARLIELSGTEELRPQAEAWLRDTVQAVVSGVPYSGGVPAPERRLLRGMHPDDGHDNLNHPRKALVPGPWTGAKDARWVLVPYLRCYYTHNGGWFLGQEYGTMAGARVEALVVLYDTATGAPAWWQALTGRHIQPMVGQASRAEMDQFLLWAEAGARTQLERGWLR